MDKPAATVLQHPSAAVHFDETPARLEAAAFDEAIRINVALELVEKLIETFGAARVMRWVRNVAAARGETV